MYSTENIANTLNNYRWSIIQKIVNSYSLCCITEGNRVLEISCISVSFKNVNIEKHLRDLFRFGINFLGKITS